MQPTKEDKLLAVSGITKIMATAQTQLWPEDWTILERAVDLISKLQTSD